MGLSPALFGLAAVPVDAAAFAEVEAGHWAYDDLNVLILEGVSDGFTGRILEPGQTLTRYEVALLVGESIHRMERVTGIGPGDESVSRDSLAPSEAVDLDKLVSEYTEVRGEDTAFRHKLEPTMYRLINEFDVELRRMGYAVKGSSADRAAARNLPSDGPIASALDESLYRLQLGSLYVSSQNRVVAEFGAPPRPLLRSFSFSEGSTARPVQWEPLSESGGRSYEPPALRVALQADAPSAGPETPRLQVSDSLSLGATWLRIRDTDLRDVSKTAGLPSEDEEDDSTVTLESGTVTGIEGSYYVSPAFLITGDYLQTEWLKEIGSDGQVEKLEKTWADSYGLGAVLTSGDVSLNAGYRQVAPPFYSDVLDGSLLGLGYDMGEYVNLGLSVQMGDVLLTTERVERAGKSRAVPRRSPDGSGDDDSGDGTGEQPGEDTSEGNDSNGDENPTRTLDPSPVPALSPQSATRVGFEGGSDVTRWRIGLGWVEEGDDRSASGDGVPTELVKVTEASLQYDLLPNASASAAWQLRSGGSEDGKLSTEFGIQYDLNSQSTLLVGYKLLDFTSDDALEEEKGGPEATATFTIRF